MLIWFCNSKRNGEYRDRENLSKEINQHISLILDQLQNWIKFNVSVTKTRSKFASRRRLLNFGDTSTLLNPEIVDEIKEGKI
jgi:acetyl-CoA synthetase